MNKFLNEINIPQCTMHTFKTYFLPVIWLQIDTLLGLSDLHEFVQVLRRENFIDDLIPVQESFNNTVIFVLPNEAQGDFDNKAKSLELDKEKNRLLRNVDISLENEDNDITEFPQFHAILRSGTEAANVASIPKKSKVLKRPSGIKKIRKKPSERAPILTGMDGWTEKGRKDHLRRIKEVTDHMTHNFMSTLYLFNEVERIRKQQVIMDELRVMALDLEHPNNRFIKQSVLKCFKVFKPVEKKLMWNKNTNNLVINVYKDPLNEGVRN